MTLTFLLFMGFFVKMFSNIKKYYKLAESDKIEISTIHWISILLWPLNLIFPITHMSHDASFLFPFPPTKNEVFTSFCWQLISILVHQFRLTLTKTVFLMYSCGIFLTIEDKKKKKSDKKCCLKKGLFVTWKICWAGHNLGFLIKSPTHNSEVDF